MAFNDSFKSNVADLLGKPRDDRAGFVIIEGGTRQERLSIAKDVEAIAAQNYTIIRIDLNTELVGFDIEFNERDLKLVTDVINRSVAPHRLVAVHDEPTQQIVVLIENYERTFKIDERLRYFLYKHEQYGNVVAWVLITKSALSASENVMRGSQVHNYSYDDWIGHVCIVKNLAKPRHRPPPTAPEPKGSQHPPTPEQIKAAILAREGQAKFRAELLRIFQDRCAVTGCAVTDILEAAHIEPYSERQDHRHSNGLILRADIHTLFDKELLTIVPIPPHQGMVLVRKTPRDDPSYKHLHTAIIDLPENEYRVRGESLQKHCQSVVHLMED